MPVPLTSLQPMGDVAALAHFSDEHAAILFAAAVRRQPHSWLLDVVQAYASVAVFFDADQIGYEGVADLLRGLGHHLSEAGERQTPQGRLHLIPCCYDWQLDLARIERHTGLSASDILALHSGTTYTVYAIGFCPGFPYLGYLPPALAGVPRLETPRLRLEAGSVGLTGRQTGIYTESRPGGWNIIGRTPLELVHVADGYFPLRTGDQIRFVPIDEGEFARRLGERL